MMSRHFKIWNEVTPHRVKLTSFHGEVSVSTQKDLETYETVRLVLAIVESIGIPIFGKYVMSDLQQRRTYFDVIYNYPDRL